MSIYKIWYDDISEAVEIEAASIDEAARVYLDHEINCHVREDMIANGFEIHVQVADGDVTKYRAFAELVVTTTPSRAGGW